MKTLYCLILISISISFAGEFPTGASHPIPNSQGWPLSLGWPIDDVPNPAYDLNQIDLGENHLIMGIDFLSTGEMVLIIADYQSHHTPSTRRPGTKIVVVNHVGQGQTPSIKEIANTWYNPGGLRVVDDEIYVSDKDAFYKINNHVNPQDLTANRTKLVDWPTPSDGVWVHGYQWHQWAYTPMFWDGHFYSPYAGSIRPGGPSDSPPSSDLSGAFLKWPKSGGPLEAFAGGLRSPNGGNIDDNGNMLVLDNQGSYLPVSTIGHMKKGMFYGHKQDDPTPNFAESWPYQPPVAWLSHDIMGASPSEPVFLRRGKYAGDWLFGDVNHMGLKRLAMDTVEGDFQGAVMWFTRGTGNAGINRLRQGEDGSIYIGTHGQMSGNWPNVGFKKPFYRLDENTNPIPFEVRRVISRSNGIELVFTYPVDVAKASTLSNYEVEQWQYVRRSEYGGFPVNDAGQGNTGNQHGTYNGFSDARNILSIQVSPDKKNVFLELENMRADRLTYVEYHNLTSESGVPQWNNRIWYTMNKISQSSAFEIKGCTQAGFKEYNPNATFDDGFCATKVINIHQPFNDLFKIKRGNHRSLSLTIKGRVGNFSIQLRDFQGKMVALKKGFGPSTITFSDLKYSGIYFLNFQLDQIKTLQKVFIQ